MPRYILQVEYDGRPFSGWQRQPDRPSVQGAIEAALSKLQAGKHTIAAAGRTDAGVHATGQIAHCDLEKNWDPYRLSQALNHHLKPNPVVITKASIAPNDFHARFSAVERQYLFRLISRKSPLTFENGQAWHIRHKLDVEAMRQGAGYLLGVHDFTTFRSAMCQADSPIRELDALDIEHIIKDNSVEYRFHVRSRSFLHNQVRSFVGTLERVGAGAWTPEDVDAALKAKNRVRCGPVCPPHGLYLAHVRYPRDPFKHDLKSKTR